MQGDHLNKTTSSENTGADWTDIPGFEGLYEAHPEGAVRYSEQHKHSGLLPTRLSDSGYHKIRLTNSNGERSAWLLHHIIYLTFNGELPPRGGAKSTDINNPLYGQVVMHGNDERDDNRAINLTLGTQRENRRMIGKTHRQFSDAQLQQQARESAL